MTTNLRIQGLAAVLGSTMLISHAASQTRFATLYTFTDDDRSA